MYCNKCGTEIGTSGVCQNCQPTNLASEPPLWNPNAVANWCLLFTPIFGVYLTYLNWLTLGESAYAQASKKWLIFWLAGFACLVSIGFLLNVLDNMMIFMRAFFIGIVMFIAWFYKDNRKQYRYIISRFGKTYPRRNWLKPLVIAAIISLVWPSTLELVSKHLIVSDTQLIKNGMLEFNKTISIGDAFDNWGDCSERSWKAFKSENGVRVVEFNCELKNAVQLKEAKKNTPTCLPSGCEWLDIAAANSTFQWTINTDNTFQISHVDSIIKWKDGRFFSKNENFLDSLDKVYSNVKTIDLSGTDDSSLSVIALKYHFATRDESTPPPVAAQVATPPAPVNCVESEMAKWEVKRKEEISTWCDDLAKNGEECRISAGQDELVRQEARDKIKVQCQ
jgi:hypothetical protein